MIWNQLSLKSRLMALVLGVSLLSGLTGGLLSWFQFRRAFQRQVFEHLTSVRAAKGKQIEVYLRGLQRHVSTLSEDRMVVAAMVELNTAYRELQNQVIANEWLKNIETYYADDFLPALAANVQSAQIVANYRPTTQAGQYLQYQYVVQNTNTDKLDLTDAGDGSRYSNVHGQYHDLFRHLIQQFGYEDLYLIDFNTGEVVYSTQKKTDYATSLDRGPYRSSHLAKVLEAVRNDPGRGFVQAADYKPYVPEYSAPVAFFAAPIYNGPHIVGVLAIQLPTQEINAMLTGNQEWVQDGLGQTGQVYVVGDDFLMRSVARPLLETPEKYQASLKRAGLSPQTLNLVEQLNTSILLQPAETQATKAALAGTIATQVVDDYRDVAVLSSYAPLRLKGLRWLIVAEMDRAEAFGPLLSLQIYMGIMGVILMLLIAALANVAAQVLFNPIQKLLQATLHIREGQRELDLDFGNDRKLSQVGDALSGLLSDIHTQAAKVTEQTAIKDTLLQNLMPSTMAKRINQETLPIVDTMAQVTVLVARIVGITALSRTQSAEEVAAMCDRLLSRFDEKARFYGIESQITPDNTYLAICGVSQVFLDHQERTVDFALELMRLVEANNEALPAACPVGIDLQIGIHTGPVVAGVVGSPKFMYKLWGETMAVALDLNQKGGANNSILITQPIYQRLKDRYLLVPRPPVPIEAVGPVPAWMVFTRTSQFTQQVEQVQTSFQQVLLHKEDFVDDFYARLWVAAPHLKTYFKENFKENKILYEQQFLDALKTAIRGLNSLDKLLPTLQEWGQKLTLYRLTETDYTTVEEVLKESLATALKSDLTPEVEQAWQSTYTLLTGAIKEATTESSQPESSQPESSQPP